MNLQDETAICLFVRTIRRLHPLAGKIPREFVLALNQYQHDSYYPNLSKEEISKVDDFIDYWKDDITRSMIIGLLTNDEGGRLQFDSLMNIAGIDTNGIEILKQVKRDVAAGRINIDAKMIDDLHKRLFKK